MNFKEFHEFEEKLNSKFYRSTLNKLDQKREDKNHKRKNVDE